VNCGVTCHNANSSATAYATGLRMRLDPAALDGGLLTAATCDTLRTAVGQPATTGMWTAPVHWTRIVPGDPSDSLLVQLISHRGKNNDAGGQMPPIATDVVDTVDVASVVAWVNAMAGAGAPDGGVEAAVGASPEAGPGAFDAGIDGGDAGAD
jgi:hypothetical protein